MSSYNHCYHHSECVCVCICVQLQVAGNRCIMNIHDGASGRNSCLRDARTPPPHTHTLSWLQQLDGNLSVCLLQAETHNNNAALSLTCAEVSRLPSHTYGNNDKHSTCSVWTNRKQITECSTCDVHRTALWGTVSYYHAVFSKRFLWVGSLVWPIQQVCCAV